MTDKPQKELPAGVDPNWKPDEKLANGPIPDEGRGCTDIIFLLLFILFLWAIWAVTGWGINQGNPNYLLHPIDSSNNLCGYTNGFQAYPYLYYPLPFSGYYNVTVCVSQCPNATINASGYSNMPTYVNCMPNLNVSHCNATGNNQTLQNYINIANSQGIVRNSTIGSMFFVYNTTTFAGSVCLPTGAMNQNLSNLSSGIVSGGGDRMTQWLADLYTDWTIILAVFFIAFFFGFLFLFLLRIAAGFIVWTTILFLICTFGALGAIFWYRAITEYNLDVTNNGSAPASGTSDYDDIMAMKVLACICWAFMGLTIIGTCVMCKALRVAVAIIKTGAQYIKETPSSLLMPVVTVILLGGYFAMWIIVALYLYTVGTPYSDGSSPVASIQWTSKSKIALGFWFFSLLWNHAFIIGMVYMFVAGSVSIWYFQHGAGQPGTEPTMGRSIKRFFRYHVGTAALGSLILAIIELFMVILKYCEWQMHSVKGKTGCCVRCLFKCAECIVSCCHKCVQFISKHAYIETMLTGKNFCLSAKDAFFLMVHNPLRFGSVVLIGDLFILIGRLFICAFSTLCGYVIITQCGPYNTTTYSVILPVIAFILVSFIVASLFMIIFGEATNTILHCFCLDEHLHKDAGGAKHCPEALATFIDTHQRDDAKEPAKPQNQTNQA